MRIHRRAGRVASTGRFCYLFGTESASTHFRRAKVNMNGVRVVLFAAAFAVLLAASCSEDSFESIPPDIFIHENDPTTEMKSLDFGSVPQKIPFGKPFFVRNKIEHAMDLTFKLSLLDSSGAPASGGTVTFSPAEGTVKGGKEIAVTATFTPPAPQAYKFKMHFETNARTASKKSFDIPVSGTGTEPKIVIDNAVIDFGDVYVGSSLPREATITNNGTGTLTILSVSASEDAGGAFSILDPPLPISGSPETAIKIEPKKDVLFTVTFSPSEERDYSGKFTLKNDDAADSNAAIEVKGRGVPVPVNGPPVANIACPEDGVMLAVPGEVELDGTGSTDKDGDPLTYKWTIKKDETGKDAAPEGSDFCFDCNRGQLTHYKESKKDKPKFFGDLVGEYVVSLVVSDDQNHDSDPVECAIHGYAAQQLHIELLWDHPSTDLDLHLVNFSDGILFNPSESGGLFTCPCDCNTSRNRNPDWGIAIPYTTGCKRPLSHACEQSCSPTFSPDCKIDPNDPATARNPDCYNGGENCVLTCEPDAADQFYEDAIDDNPRLDIDDTKGFGPENINIVKPSEGLYRIFVHYFDDYGMGNSGATVRLYINGKTKPEWKFGAKVMQNPVGGTQIWEVAMVQWPADANDEPLVTAVDALRDAVYFALASCTLPRDGGTDDGGASADSGAEPDLDGGTPDAGAPDGGAAD